MPGAFLLPTDFTGRYAGAFLLPPKSEWPFLKRSSRRCFQNRRFSPCRYGGVNEREMPVWGQHPMKTMLNTVYQQRFSGSGVTCPGFLHRRVADNMQPLTGCDAGIIRRGIDGCWYLWAEISKKSRPRFPKNSILDIKKWKEKTTMMIRVLKNFSGGGATLPDFLHVGVRDVWPNAQHELRLGENLLRCFQNCCFSPYIGDEFSPIIR